LFRDQPFDERVEGLSRYREKTWSTMNEVQLFLLKPRF